MIDSHCHLADDGFEADLDGVVARAREAGVEAALCILAAGDEQEAARARVVRDKWDAVLFATGVHPHSAGAFEGRADKAAATTETHAAAFDAVAVGEIGLDYHYDFAPRAVQRAVFAMQIDIAKQIDKPIIIHTREAEDDTFAILEERGGARGVFHCFTGDTAMARRALDAGFYLSFAGIVSFPKAESLRDAARMVPADRLLIETDSPDLAPVPHRGKRNEPAYVAQVLGALAAARGEDPADLAKQTSQNFARLFRRG